MENGQKEGHGTVISLDGTSFIGEFKNNLANGQGTATYNDGSKYIGNWKNGNHEGTGTYFFANGDKYVGEWRNSKQNGQGTLTFANGHVFNLHEWKNGIARDKDAEFRAQFKPRPGCEDQNIDDSNFMKCLNEKSTAKAKFYETH